MEEEIDFDFIQKLQYLVRDEISTREAAKRNYETLSTNIINKIKEIYSIKIKILSEEKTQLDSSKNKNSTSFKLDEDNLVFKKNSMMKQTIEAFFLCLRKDTEIIYKILTGLTLNEIQLISSLIMNNFYENIISPYKTEDELLILIYRLLELEINFLNSKKDFNVFLQNNTCGILLKQLCSKIEVQEFFGNILEDILSRIENQNEIDWDFSFDNLKKLYESNREKNLLVPETFSTQKEDLNAKFIKNYFSMFHKKFLMDLKEKTENNDLKEYYNHLLLKFSEDKPNYFSNNVLINLFYEEENSEELLNEYTIIFFNLKQSILLILNNLIENINLIPYSLKCICKIISILLHKKFPDINIIEETLFISKFFFLTIFKTIFLEPDVKGLISSFIISQHTRDKIKLVLNILEILVSGEIYNGNDNKEMTPFNLFFIKEGMPKVLELTKKITNISFSNYITKLINGLIPENDFYYDYFIENPNSKRVQYTICYQPQDFYILMNILKNFDKKFFVNDNIQSNYNDNIFVNRKILSNIISKFSIKNNINFVENIFLKEKNYYLVSKTETSPQFSHLANFDEKLKPYKNKLKHIKDGLEKTLLEIENYICELLFRFPPLDRRDFPLEEFSFLSFLEEIKKFGNIKDEMSIPFEWYCEILFQLLTQLPEEYQQNNFKKVLNLLKNHLNSSIELYKKNSFDWHSVELVSTDLLNKLKRNLEALEEINDNKLIMNQIKQLVFPIYMNASFSKNFDIFTTNQIGNSTPRNSSKLILCNNIKDFINKFPDFVKYANQSKNSLLDLEKECRVTEVINKYIELVKKQKTFVNEEKFSKYIYSSLYSKMSLNITLDDDLLLYQKCIGLSWIEMKNIDMKIKHFYYSNLLLDAKKLFNDFENENSPMGKMKAINNIETLIYKVLTFNGIELPGEDDKTPLRIYIFIKSTPKKFISSLNYLMSVEEGYGFLSNYSGIADSLLKDEIKFEGITEKEYKINCAKAIERWCNSEE